jgi:hypothetical protein
MQTDGWTYNMTKLICIFLQLFTANTPAKLNIAALALFS